jgi:hypothetical protein
MNSRSYYALKLEGSKQGLGQGSQEKSLQYRSLIALISTELDWLKAKEAEHLAELKKTQEAIKAEKARLECIPALVSQAKDEY